MPTQNKQKIVNDPVYGFISIPTALVFDLMEHPWFQRLRRIKQLGLTHYTYPSAMHSRFQHALGAMHLMAQAIAVLQSKEIPITKEETQGALVAILLHDMGHGPYSHTLEQTIVRSLDHEDLSKLFMAALNRQHDGALETAFAIFCNTYPKKFLHQLVSSQLDMDRLDYLARDSFFTGVAEGVISYERIIKMLTVCHEELVVEGKSIYSIEKFLISRRLMYWQVYLHKTVIAADQILINLLRRAKYLTENGDHLFSTPSFGAFLRFNPVLSDFETDPFWLETFAKLDDFDIFTALKVWTGHPDPILSYLCQSLVNRNLLHSELQSEPFSPELVERVREAVIRQFRLDPADVDYYVTCDQIGNKTYNPSQERIMIKEKSGRLTDISRATERDSSLTLPNTVTKYLLCYPKDVTIY